MHIGDYMTESSMEPAEFTKIVTFKADKIIRLLCATIYSQLS